MKCARGFFTPSLVAVLLAVIFIAVLFGTRVRDKSAPAAPRYSERYHELHGQAQRSPQQQAEFELEACRYRRDLLNYLKFTNTERYREVHGGYDSACGQVLPLQ